MSGAAGLRESGSGAWSEEDEAIIATNTEAAECKRCAVELGYWQDDYIQYFAKRGARKPPEINRGYYTRVKLIELFVQQFLERCDTKCQIINLGCGFDTLYWRLKDQTQAIANFIELDLPTVTAKKCSIIKRNKQLLEKIANEEGEVALRGAGELHAAQYHLAACDLRAAGGVLRALAACGVRPAAPTLLLAECVLVYLRPAAADELLRALAALLPDAALLVYEQCNLRDRFGAVMVAELARRGCVSVGMGPRGDHGELAARARAAGWAGAAAWSLRAAAAALPAPPAAARAADPLDEPELLDQLHDHYALLAAHNGATFADLDIANLQP